MAYPSVTYSFTNGTTISATEVNQNFTDLINGASNGTKDYNINALTVAGTANLNGAVNLGNATSDDVTVTGYLASALIPKADDTYDLGTAALAWKDGYFDGEVKTDTISELTSASGVTVDGVLLKDNSTTTSTSVITPLIKAYDGNGIKLQENGGTEVMSISDSGLVTMGPASGGSIEHIIRSGQGTGSTILVLNKTAVGAGTTTSYFLNFAQSGTPEGFILHDGSGNMAFANASDIRLKTNVKNITGLDKVLRLRPISFDWIDGTGNENLGFIAQEVEQVLPKSVSISPDGDTKLLSIGSELLPLLTKAIQEQQAMIEALQAKVATLEAK